MRRFRLADPDVFDVVNFNRQAGATMSTLGQRKAVVLKRMIEDINPEAEVEAWTYGLDEKNTKAFVAGADVVIDGVDFFAFETRRRLVRTAQDAGAWTVTCGPIGFGAAFVAFAPDGMSFDDYFDKLAVGHVWGGGARNPMHWLRRAVARAKLRKLGVFRAPPPPAERA